MSLNPLEHRPEPHSRELACLKEIREDLAASYPHVSVQRIASILRKHKRSKLPAGLLIDSPTLIGGLRELYALKSADANVAFSSLFSESAYRVLNPDVAAAGDIAWIHYQVYGRLEGRVPHPFVDLKWLAASMPGVPIGDVFDRYLTLPEFWRIDPSPYIDAQRFVLSGQWNESRNPLAQIVTSHLSGPWVHHRLMLVDSASADGAFGHSVAIATLMAKNGAVGTLGEFALWRQTQSGVSRAADNRPGVGYESSVEQESRVEHTVVPGFFAAADGEVLWSVENGSLSLDSTVIQLEDEFLGVVSGPSYGVENLVVIQGSLSGPQARRVVEEAGGHAAIAPSSAAQQHALEQIVRTLGYAEIVVLEFGKQARVISPRLTFAPATHFSPPHWNPDTERGRSVSIMVGFDDLADSLRNSTVLAALGCGARICPVNHMDVAAWQPLVGESELVVVAENLVRAVREYVNDEAIRVFRSSDLVSGGQA